MTPTQQEFRDFVQTRRESLTRTEFNSSFAKLGAFVRKSIADLHAQTTKRLAELKDGYTPVKGKDYFDGAPGKMPVAGKDFPLPKDGYTPIKGVDYFDGVDADEEVIAGKVVEMVVPKATDAIGKNLPALGTAIRDGLELLQGENRLSVSAIQGLEEHIGRVVEPYSMGGGAVVSVQSNGVNKVNQAGTLNFKGGGAPTVSVGANGVTELDFPAGSGINPQAPSGTINSVNTTFICSGLVQVAFVDGVVDPGATITGAVNSTVVYSIPPQNSVFAL